MVLESIIQNNISYQSTNKLSYSQRILPRYNKRRTYCSPPHLYIRQVNKENTDYWRGWLPQSAQHPGVCYEVVEEVLTWPTSSYLSGSPGIHAVDVQHCRLWQVKIRWHSLRLIKPSAWLRLVLVQFMWTYVDIL